MMGFALVEPRKSPRSRLNCAYAPAKAVRGALGVTSSHKLPTRAATYLRNAPKPDSDHWFIPAREVRRNRKRDRRQVARPATCNVWRLLRGADLTATIHNEIGWIIVNPAIVNGL